MAEINTRLYHEFQLQQDDVFEAEEEKRLLRLAADYAFAEGALAVMSNLRTNVSHIYYGYVGESLGFAPRDCHQQFDTVWEENIFSRIHPDDLKLRHLQELVFYCRMSAKEQPLGVYPWHLENTMRIKDSHGDYRNVLHRIFYFPSMGKRGVCYALCLYSFVTGLYEKARMVNMQTGDVKIIEVEDCRHLLSEREKGILRFIRKGLASKEIAEQVGISKHTVDRHRQNIIAKLQVRNSAEACHRAKELGLID